MQVSRLTRNSTYLWENNDNDKKLILDYIEQAYESILQINVIVKYKLAIIYPWYVYEFGRNEYTFGKWFYRFFPSQIAFLASVIEVSSVETYISIR